MEMEVLPIIEVPAKINEYKRNNGIRICKN
jgi:hypothetical protein